MVLSASEVGHQICIKCYILVMERLEAVAYFRVSATTFNRFASALVLNLLTLTEKGKYHELHFKIHPRR